MAKRSEYGTWCKCPVCRRKHRVKVPAGSRFRRDGLYLVLACTRCARYAVTTFMEKSSGHENPQ